ncbi:hypothetical protein CBS101457_000576 [Exobasidium rhododendri]|nr:hypothetical protein CBS101457_000576 [Exobasidium rhododendri]
MAATKRRRSGHDLNQERKEEEALTASLFGTKRSRKVSDFEDILSDEDRDEGSSNARVNTEQHLDDDQLFMMDTGADDHESREEENGEEEEGSELDSDSLSVESSSEPEDGVASSDTTAAYMSERRRPVWTDSGSSNLKISLAGSDAKGANGTKVGTKKLRKLREAEGEMQITGAEYEVRLRKVFEKFHPRPEWASLSLRKPERTSNGETTSTDSGREALSDLLSRDIGLVNRVTKRGKQNKERLPKDRFEVERLRNANEAQGRATFSAIESLSFHPTTRAHVLMTTTKDRRLRLFQVDGNTNPLLETLHIPDLPLQSALFHPSGSSILLSGPRPFFYSHDLESGKTVKSTPWRGFGSSAQGAEEKDLSTVCFQKSGMEQNRSLLAIGGRRGAIHLLEWGSVGGSGGGSLIGSLHMNAPLAGLTWDPSRSNSLVSLSTRGTVHSWDVRNMKCEVQKSDAGLFDPKGIKGSPRSDSWAIGSENGIVNVYDGQELNVESKSISTMRCLKSIKNVTMTSSILQYNHTGEILAIGSDKKKDMLKFVHTPSMTVFENWPTAGTPLGRVTSVDFTNSSEYVAIGNSRGKVLLYSLHHFL